MPMSPLIFAVALSVMAVDTAPVPTPASATSQTPSAGPASPQPGSPAPDPNKVLCRAQVITGSRFMKRICMSRADWAEYDRRQEQETTYLKRKTDDMAGLPTTAGPGGPGGN
jgi:hypothetical protein